VGSAQQGYSVSLSADGNTAIVGGPYDNSVTGAAWVFVNASCTSPSITVQPQPQTIASGQTATLSVTATGTATLSYQWYQGFSGTTTTPVGTNSHTFTTPTLTATTPYWVKVSNSCGHENSDTAIINLGSCPTITLSPLSLPSGAVGVTYSQPITASGGTGPYSYAKTSGTYPPGLMLTGNTLSGTPTTADTYTFTITATDSSAQHCVGSRVYSVQITGSSTLNCASNPHPSDNSMSVSTTPTLQWDFVAGADSYDVYFGTSPSPPFVANQVPVYYSPGTLQAGTIYYWKVIPKNSAVSAAGCPVWSFQTIPPLSGRIQIKDPATREVWPLNGTGITSLTVQASLVDGGEAIPGEATKNGSAATYSFTTLVPGRYVVTLSIGYKEEVTVSNGHCDSATLDKTTTSYMTITVPASGAIADFDLPLPVVFLHGISACYTKWDDWDPALRTETALTGAGFITFTPNYDYGSSLWNAMYWELSARQTLFQITAGLSSLTMKSPNPPFFIIAHSMGGLISRVLTSGALKDQETVKKIRWIYMAGTPNSGSDLPGANLIDHYLSEDVIQKDFNKAYSSFGAKPVTAFSGTDGLLLSTDSCAGGVRPQCVP
jgi:hypothetical protein